MDAWLLKKDKYVGMLKRHYNGFSKSFTFNDLNRVFLVDNAECLLRSILYASVFPIQNEIVMDFYILNILFLISSYFLHYTPKKFFGNL